MAKIKSVIPREILNAAGQPTIETTVVLTDGTTGSASSPSGGADVNYEAAEYSPGNKASLQTHAIAKAIDDIQNAIGPKIIGQEADRQREIDNILIGLDGTQNKSNLGANTLLSVSVAVAKAAAASSVLPLFLYLREFIKKEEQAKIPVPIFSMVNGGKTNNNNIDFAEILAIPASSKTYQESIWMGYSISDSLKKNIASSNLPTLTTGRGAYAPSMSSNQEACGLLKTSLEGANLKLNFDIFMGIDAASNELIFQGNYKIKDKNTYYSRDELISYYEDLAKTFNLLYIEDGLQEEDWDGWAKLYSKLSQNIIIAGDDIVATNPYRLQMALNKKALSAVLIKPNQVGTVLEALAFSEIAHAAGLKTIVSHRSMETNDDFIADFAVATSADYVKFGGLQRGENISKYNRLTQIEKQLKVL